MSLATRCTACGTVFRVVQDQLKVSEGWVRCGKCQQVFSAMDGLFDLDLKAAGSMPVGTGSGFAPSPAVSRVAEPSSRAGTAPGRSVDTPFDPPLFAPPEKASSVWRGKRGEERAAGTTGEPPGPSLPHAPNARRLDPPVIAGPVEPPRLDSPGAGADDGADGIDALQIQPLDQEETPFVLRRPAIEARAFDRPSDRPSLPGAEALRRATEERRDAQTETMPATFDRASMDDWRPSGADAHLDHVAASRGLHIDLLIDDVDRPRSPAVATPGDAPQTARPEPAAAAAAAPPAMHDSHVLGGTLTDGSLEQHIADAADPPPAFLRDAERRSYRDTPRLRRWLIGLAGAMAVLLCLQFVFHSRDVIAARFPALGTPLAAMCAVAGCTLGPPRRIEEVVVDSSALTRVEGMDAFQLTVVLRNRSTMPLAMPSVDLTLTDTDGQLVSRRALQPADFASTATALAPSGEQTLKLMLSAGERRITGYTVELFYP